MDSNIVSHPFEPVYDKNSRILVLGTIPSPKSREVGFYYSHPQNRFWPVMSVIFNADIPTSAEGKREFLLGRHVALWDVLAECAINSADDASIKSPVANDMSRIFRAADIKAVFTTGRKAHDLYVKYCMNSGGECALKPCYLPSTSPANQGKYNLEALASAYKMILDYLL